MNIIKHGKTFTIKFVCDVCGCVFEAEHGEYKVETIRALNTLRGKHLKDGIAAICECPECNQTALRYLEETE